MTKNTNNKSEEIALNTALNMFTLLFSSNHVTGSPLNLNLLTVWGYSPKLRRAVWAGKCTHNESNQIEGNGEGMKWRAFMLPYGWDSIGD